MQFSAKKSSKNGSKSNQNWKGCSAPKKAYRHSWSADRDMASADRHFPSVDWPKYLARSRNLLIKKKPIFFEFLEISTRSNSYMILFSLFFMHPKLYKLGGDLPTFSTLFWPLFLALLFWLLRSPYIKDVLEALTLRTFFCK